MASRVTAGLGAVLLAGSVVGGILAPSTLAGAVTAVTLYVRAGATGTTCAARTSTAACGGVKQAVTLAQTTDAGKAVTITVGTGTYSTQTISITTALASLTITGAGAHTTALSGTYAGGIFHIGTAHAVHISGLTIEGGGIEAGGGAYVSDSATVQFTNDIFLRDTAFAGGGAYVTTSNVTFTGVTFRGNGAYYGGGIAAQGSTVHVSDDTFVHDSGFTSGGGMDSYESAVQVTNVTFVHDRASTGGAFYNSGFATLVDVTFGTDPTGGAIYVAAPTIVANSIFSNAYCTGTTGTGSVTGGGHNVETGDSCGLSATPSSISTSTTIDLHHLNANTSTGPETMAIGTTSAAFEIVPSTPSATACTVRTDERGTPRPGIPTAACDAGAYEYQTGATIPATPTPTPTLYVRQGATGLSCTASTSARACSSISGALTVAVTFTGEAVSITVGAGTFTEHLLGVTARGLTSLTIEGAGPSSTTVDGQTKASVFLAHTGAITIEGMSITHGTATDGYGGGIDTYGGPGTIVLENDTFATDHAHTKFGEVNGYSGAVNITTTGHVTFIGDTFSSDTARMGGAIHNFGGTATVVDSTFVNDSATTGGAVATTQGGTTSLGFDTFFTDTATTTGGAIFSGTAGSTTADASIFDAASCGGGGSLSGTYDVVTTTTGCPSTTGVTTTQATIGLTPTLGANGAPTAPETLALLATSRAIGEVPAASCAPTVNGTTVTTDERGFPRQVTSSATCDAGAYELQLQTHTPVSTALDALLAAVTGVLPGTSLTTKVEKVISYLATGDLTAACGTLNAFIDEVEAQTGKKITPPTSAATLIAQATTIRILLGC